jgi:GlpG protein
MRRAGQLTNKSDAERFVSYLISEKMDAQLTEDDPGIWTIWVYNEDHVAPAQYALREFLANPNDKKFKVKVERKEVIEPEVLRPAQPRSHRARNVDVRAEMFDNTGSTGRVTLTLIILSILATFVLDLPAYEWLKAKLYYSEYMGHSFPEILSGQVWRLVTPIFLHGGFLHLLFNMLWIYQLSGQMEQLEGSLYTAVLTIVFAIIVNTSQYLVSGPAFVGMSGVLYAMLGYTWMMAQYSTKYSYMLAPGTVMMMVIWMIICLVGIIPNVANTQHVVGFVIGVSYGFIRSGEIRLRIRQWLRKRQRH